MKKIGLVGLAVLCCVVACLAVERKAKVAATSADAKYPTYDGAPTDGSARTGNDSRVLRGGGLRSTDRRCRTASRHAYHRTHSSYYVGCRITCAIAPKVK